MRTYTVSIKGKTPLLQHSDNIEWADLIDRWRHDPRNRNLSKPGDDRSPAFRWIGCLYHDGINVAIPSDSLMRCLMEGGAMVTVPGGRSGKTFKSQTQSGCVVAEPFWPLRVKGRTVDYAQIASLMDESDFQKHQDLASALGFTLYVKRAKIGKSKHIRVRPRFDDWSCQGTLSVWDEQLTSSVVQQIWSFAGQYKGLCDWRPGGPTPGPHGMFDVTVTESR